MRPTNISTRRRRSQEKRLRFGGGLSVSMRDDPSASMRIGVSRQARQYTAMGLPRTRRAGFGAARGVIHQGHEEHEDGRARRSWPGRVTLAQRIARQWALGQEEGAGVHDGAPV